MIVHHTKNHLFIEDKGDRSLLGACKINQQGKGEHPHLESSPKICIFPVDAQRWEPLSSYPEFSVLQPASETLSLSLELITFSDY